MKINNKRKGDTEHMDGNIINFKTNPDQLEKSNRARGTVNGSIAYRVPAKVVTVKANQKLPEYVVKGLSNPTIGNSERNNIVLALIGKGWTISAISRGTGLVTGSIHYIRKTHTPSHVTTFHIPTAPRTVRPPRIAIYMEPTPELLSKLLELKPLAMQVRANSPKYREEGEEYTYLLNEALTTHGTTIYRLAKLLKVTPSGIHARLVRYGYQKTKHGKTKAYRPITKENRATYAK